MKIFAHIAGPSGSGKTTLGEKIKKKFPFVVIKDLDEFYRPYLDKGVNSSVMDVKNMLKKDIVKFLKENKNSTIIFTGSNTITQSNDFSDAIYYNIEADQKKDNNIYRDSKGYTYIKKPVDPSYWIYQFAKLFEHSDCRWIVVNRPDWKMPADWSKHKNVFAETYEGMAKYIEKQLTKSK